MGREIRVPSNLQSAVELEELEATGAASPDQ